MEAVQKSLELILARNLLSSISTPAFLIDAAGEVVFFNEAAGAILGQRFEETGPMPAERWTQMFGPLGSDGQPVPYEKLPLTVALRANRPAHKFMTIRSFQGVDHEIEASALPIVGTGGFFGAMVFFWPTTDEEE
jgi:PAS domain-containing protein